MLNNEFVQNKSVEEISNNFESNKDGESEKAVEQESGFESSEVIENFAKEKIESLSAEIKESMETGEAGELAILKLGGDLKVLENLTRDVDSETKDVGNNAIIEIVKWVKLDNPSFDEDNFYRIIDENGYRDFVENRIVRSSPSGTKSIMVGNIEIGHKSTPFPSFAKGAPDLRYATRGEENYILESDTPMYKHGESNPITGKRIVSKHWAYRPLNEDGSWKTELDPEEIKNVYKIDKDGDIYIKDTAKKKEELNENDKIDN